MDFSIEKVNQNDKICTLIFWIILLAKQLCGYGKTEGLNWFGGSTDIPIRGNQG